MEKGRLLVGGPYDGVRVSNNGLGLRLPYQKCDPIELRETEYRAERIRGDGWEKTIMVEQSLSIEDAIARLIEHYKPEERT